MTASFCTASAQSSSDAACTVVVVGGRTQVTGAHIQFELRFHLVNWARWAILVNKEHPMATKPIPLPSPAPRSPRRKPVEVIALLAVRPLSDGELKRVSRALAAEGIEDMRPTRIFLTQDDAKAVAAGDERAVPASIVRDSAPRPARARRLDVALTEALVAARARGATVKEDLLTDPEMLNTAAIAHLLGMSEEGVRLKRKRHEILGLEFAKRGIRYPAWQVLEGRQLLPALPLLFAMLGNDPWRLFRFLQQHHGELGGERALDALRHGEVNGVLAAAGNTATGAFA
jgi:hypothetical protein